MAMMIAWFRQLGVFSLGSSFLLLSPKWRDPYLKFKEFFESNPYGIWVIKIIFGNIPLLKKRQGGAKWDRGFTVPFDIGFKLRAIRRVMPRKGKANEKLS